MGELEWRHRKHGHLLHDQVDFQLERHVTIHGGKIKDGRVFKEKYHLPCEPDLYFTYSEKRIDGNNRSTVEQPVVVEVESDATAERTLLKQRQYEESLKGVRLYVLNLKEIPGDNWKDWTYLDNWIGARMPI